MIEHRFDVTVIGAGPAGLAAAASARGEGASVALIDENADTGGQIWRRDEQASAASPAARRRAELEASGVEVLCGSAVFGAEGRKVLHLHSIDGEGAHRLQTRVLVLATGATELFLPFEGWTLPRVVGAGGLQVLAKSGLDLKGRRVLVAGSGPLLMAVAASFVERGAEVVGWAEQAPQKRIRSFGAKLWRHPRKLGQAAAYAWKLRGIKRHFESWPLAAHADEAGNLEAVTLKTPAGEHRLVCDFLACGFGLVPETRLGRLLGCDSDEAGALIVDDHLQTTVPGVFAAGECCGIGGLECALIEGRMSGRAAARQAREEDLQGPDAEDLSLRRRRATHRELAGLMRDAFRLDPRLRSLPRDDTIVCRCEDARWENLCHRQSWREAKLTARAGMGLCQGRVCGPALEFLKGWPAESPRPPLLPVTLADLEKVGRTEMTKETP